MGVLNAEAVRAASEGYEITFNNAFKGVDPMWTSIAMKAPSGGSGNNYVWLSQIPQLREWLGERQVNNLEAHSYFLKNKTFELTVGIKRADFEDDNLGAYQPVIGNMGGQAARHPDKLVFSLLSNGFTQSGYDSVPFFSTVHPGGEDDTKWSNKGTKELAPASYGDARTAMMSLTDKHGEPLGLISFTLVVSPANEGMAKTILEAEKLDDNTNPYRNTAKLVVAPRLVKNPKHWFLIAEVDGLKPFIFQMRSPPEFTAMDQLTDSNMFFQGQAVYGVEGRWNAGYGLPQLAWGSDGTVAE